MNFNSMNRDVEPTREQNHVATSSENEARDFFRQAASAYNADDFALALAAVADGPVEEGDEIKI